MLLDPLGSSPATTPHARGGKQQRARRWWVCGLAVGGLLLAAGDGARAAVTGSLHLRCTNPASGTSWPIVVDLDHNRVDLLAATITDKRITWHDPKQGYFDFDRATGQLQFRNASSTGGYFLHYTCRPE